MPLKYKVSLSIFIISSLILAAVSLFYSQWSYRISIADEKQMLSFHAHDAVYHLNYEFQDKISNALTLGSSALVRETLLDSNRQYAALAKTARDARIDSLNQRWKQSDAQAPLVIERLNNPLAELLKRQQALLPGTYGELFITNRYGAMIASSSKLSTLAHAHKYWWQHAWHQGQGRIFLDDRGFDDSVNGYVIGVVVPIRHQGEVIGVLKANVNIVEALGNIVQRFEAQHDAELMIVRSKGKIVYQRGQAPLSTHLSAGLRQHLQAALDPAHIQAIKGQVFLIAHQQVVLNFQGQPVLLGGKPHSEDHSLGNQGESWHVLLQKPQAMVLQRSEQVNRWLLLIGGGLVLIAALLAYLTGRYISWQQMVLAKAQAEHNRLLEQQVVIKTEENIKQLELLQQQSKMAAMGEMIGAIAHQWRQPLNELSIRIQKLKMHYAKHEIDEAFIQSFIEKNKTTIRFMSHTIDDFRNFFRVDKEKLPFEVKKSVEEVLNIQQAQLKNHNIQLQLQGEGFVVNGFKTEFQQVMMNVIANAKDAVMMAASEQPMIWISLQPGMKQVQVQDNGGGVDAELLPRIFEPYFTTKPEGQGTGLGLYMSRQIIQNMQGRLMAENQPQGLQLTIQFSQVDNN